MIIIAYDLDHDICCPPFFPPLHSASTPCFNSYCLLLIGVSTFLEQCTAADADEGIVVGTSLFWIWEEPLWWVEGWRGIWGAQYILLLLFIFA